VSTKTRTIAICKTKTI